MTFNCTFCSEGLIGLRNDSMNMKFSNSLVNSRAIYKYNHLQVKTDSEHKLAKSKYAEDTEILRVPIALAMVRLLQFLPHRALEQSLPGYVLYCMISH